MPKYRFSINRGSQYILHIQVDILSKEIFIFRCIKRFYLNYRFCRISIFLYVPYQIHWILSNSTSLYRTGTSAYLQSADYQNLQHGLKLLKHIWSVAPILHIHYTRMYYPNTNAHLPLIFHVRKQLPNIAIFIRISSCKYINPFNAIHQELAY